MRDWVRGNIGRIAALVGLLSLNVMDAANNNLKVSNGFWNMDSDQAFHLGLWTAALAFIVGNLRKGS